MSPEVVRDLLTLELILPWFLFKQRLSLLGMYSSGWLNQNENLSSAYLHYPQSLCDQKLFLLQINLSVEECPRSLQFSEISVCECEKHLYFQVRLTAFAPPLLFQRHWRHEVVQVTTLLYGFSWERVPCFVVSCMLLPCILCTEWSVTTPPPLQTHISRILKRLAPYSDLNPSTNIFVVFCLQGLKQADGTSDLRHLQGRPISSEIWQEYLTRLSASLVQAMLGCFNSSPEIQSGHERQFLSSSYTCQVAEQESGEATILRFMHVHLAILLQIFFDDLLISICYSWVLY